MNKFLFILPTDRLGGAERVTMNLIRYIHSNYKKTTIYVYFMSKGDSGCWNELKGQKNIKLIFNDFSSEKKSFPYMVYYIFRNIKSIDFIYTTHTHINALFSLLKRCKIIQSEFLVMRESTIISQRFSGIKKLVFDILYQAYGMQDLLICQTNLMLNEIVRVRGKRIAANVQLIPNPLHLDSVNLKLLNRTLERDINDKFLIIIVGRLIPIKNHMLVLQALAELPSKQQRKIELKIIGDGPLKGYLQRKVMNLELSSTVGFVGNVANPYQYMTEADLGVVSSVSEGFPNVLIEMMASGTKNLVITPCTGDLDMLPKVTIIKDHSIEHMKEAIMVALSEKHDYSKDYLAYSKTRDVCYYWHSILKYLKVTE